MIDDGGGVPSDPGPAGHLEVRPATDGDREGWNRFVAAAATPATNRFEWAGVLESVYRVPTTYLVAEDRSGSIRGVLGLYETRTLRGRRHVHSLRHGLVAADDAAARALVTATVERFPAADVADISVTSGYRDHDLPMASRRRASLVLPLTADEDAMWSALGKKSRNLVRKAQKAGVEVHSSPEHLDDVCRIYERHMVAMGVSIHRRSFFQRVLEALDDDAELLVATHEGRVIGGTLVLYAPHVAIYPYQTAAGEHMDKAPNQIMIWETMRAAARRGIERLDMGESQRGGSTYRFKHNFGGEDVDVHYYHPLRPAPAPVRAEDGQDPDETPADRVHGRRLTARLPYPVAREMHRYLRRRGRIV